MSVLLLAAVAIPGGLAAFLTFGRPRLGLAIGSVTAILAVAVAATIGAQDAVPLAGTVVSGSDGLRTVALTWAAVIALLGLADVLVGSGGAAPAPPPRPPPPLCPGGAPGPGRGRRGRARGRPVRSG